MNEQPFDPIADLRMAVEQIKREPKPQPDMVPWDEYQPRIMVAQETWRTLKRVRCVAHWQERKRGKRRPWNWAPRRRLEAQIERLSKRRLHEPAD